MYHVIEFILMYTLVPLVLIGGSAIILFTKEVFAEVSRALHQRKCDRRQRTK